MNLGSWLLVGSLLVILVLFTLLRPRAGARKYPEIVQSLIFDVKINIVLAETFKQRPKPKLFEHNNWEINKNKIGFLTETLKEMLKQAFGLVDEYNVELKAAKKNKSESYKNLDLTKFKELLDKCLKDLEDWMIDHTGQKELPLKYPSIWNIFFGERS
jgi:hypothetical protein